MFENEGTEAVESGVEAESPSETPQETKGDSTPAKAEVESKPATDENVPFHKHPRWIERDNELKTERQARQKLEQSYQAMESRIAEMSKPKPAPVADKWAPLKERLKGIDPEFAEYVASLAPQAEIQEMREQEAQRQSESQRQYAVGAIERMHAENKVTGELAAFYNQQFEAAYMKDPKGFPQNVAAIYKQVHESATKLVEGIKRDTTQSYVKDKKSDAQGPASISKGKAVDSKGKFTYSKDPEEARAQMVSRFADKMRAAKAV